MINGPLEINLWRGDITENDHETTPEHPGPSLVFVVYLYLDVCPAYLQPFVNCKSLRRD